MPGLDSALHCLHSLIQSMTSPVSIAICIHEHGIDSPPIKATTISLCPPSDRRADATNTVKWPDSILTKQSSSEMSWITVTLTCLEGLIGIH